MSKAKTKFTDEDIRDLLMYIEETIVGFMEDYNFKSWDDKFREKMTQKAFETWLAREVK